MKEIDRILGGFAEEKLEDLSDQLSRDFDKLLDVSDADLLNWILGRDDVPKPFNNEIFQLIIKYKESL